MLNQKVSSLLFEAASLLEEQGANSFRVEAYRKAARAIAGLRDDLADVIDGNGYEYLFSIPGIGPRMAHAILEIRRTGHWAQLDRLRGENRGADVLSQIPGLGPELAARIHESCGIDTLEELEVAAYDGRLARVFGIGPRRLKSLRAYLEATLGRRGRWALYDPEPPVETILAVDQEYREKLHGNNLMRIAPKRFNPNHERWLTVLHTVRDGWHFSVLFSNTERAHRLGRTSDWVIVAFSDSGILHGQRTVVTETHGPLTGMRVVRGRERECSDYYDIPFHKAS